MKSNVDGALSRAIVTLLHCYAQYSSSSSPKRPPISTSSTSSFFSSSTGAAAYAAPVAAPAAGAFFAAFTKASAYGNEYPLARETARRFLNPLRRECGADAVVANPAPRERDA